MNRILRDLDAPRVSAADIKAGAWLIAFALLFIALTSVDYPR